MGIWLFENQDSLDGWVGEYFVALDNPFSREHQAPQVHLGQDRGIKAFPIGARQLEVIFVIVTVVHSCTYEKITQKGK